MKTLSTGRAKALAAVAAMVVGAGAVATTVASPAFAETFTVTSNADSGPGTLRAAVAAAAATDEADTITFDLPKDKRTITLSSQITFLLQKVTIDGADQGVTVSGGKSSRVFDVLPTGNLTVRNLTVVDARAVDAGVNGSLGGGIRNVGTLAVSGSTFSGNTAGFGAGIYNNGFATVTGSTFKGNTAIANLAANGFGGGIDNRGVVKVDSSTFSGNSAAKNGGGFRNGNIAEITNSTLSGNSAALVGGGAANNGVTMKVVSSTLSGNRAGVLGGGVSSVESPRTAILRNTIVAGSAKGDCEAVATLSVVTDGGYNISSDRTCGFSAAKGSKAGTDPELSPEGLADNGGPTRTIALEKGSPAVDAIPRGASGCGTAIDQDQRGVARPQGKGCDIGAFELDRACPKPDSGDDGKGTKDDGKKDDGKKDDGDEHHDAKSQGKDDGEKDHGGKDDKNGGHEPAKPDCR